MKKEKVKKVKSVIEKILLILFYLCFLIILIDDISDFIKNDELEDAGSWIIIAVVFLYALLASLKNTSNLILFLIATYFIAILLNLFTKLNLGDIPLMSFTFIFFIYVVIFVKSLFKIKRNGFLKIMIIVTTFLTLLYLILQVTLMSGSLDGYDILLKIINVIFIIIALSMIFSLPNSNFFDWAKDHKVFFVKSILSIWILFFLLSISRLFIPDSKFRQLIFPEIKNNWFMKDYSIENKPGMKYLN
jgi:hypothetical protein